jgi:hypothetical protein
VKQEDAPSVRSGEIHFSSIFISEQTVFKFYTERVCVLLEEYGNFASLAGVNFIKV